MSRKTKKFGITSLFTKTPHSLDLSFFQVIDTFVEDKLNKRFGNRKCKIILAERVRDVGDFPERFYAQLRGKWSDLPLMLGDLKNMPIDLRLYFGPWEILGYLKNLAGRTIGETSPKTIRGMIRGIHGAPQKDWFNGIHVSHPDEVAEDLRKYRHEGFIPISLEEWKKHTKIYQGLKGTLESYGLI